MQLLRLYHGADWPSSRADGTRIRYVRCRMHQRAPEVCGNKTCTDMDALENAVLERIRAYAADYFDPEKVTLPEQDDPIQQREQAKRDELKRLKSEADRRRKAMQELYLDKASGLIDAVQFSEMNQTFLEEVKRQRPGSIHWKRNWNNSRKRPV